MAYRKLRTVWDALDVNLEQTERLVYDTGQWMSVLTPKGVPKFTARHREIVTELAFLRAFLAWELFLEETFVLYLLGKKPPKGRSPHRYVSPPTREVAENIVIPEGRDYVSWTVASTVADRATRFFRGGEPFAPALRSQINTLNEMRTIRNAIAHWQSSAQDKFKNVVRNKPGIGSYPAGLTVGGFLTMRIPASSPPESFFSDYLKRIRITAEQVVPH